MITTDTFETGLNPVIEVSLRVKTSYNSVTWYVFLKDKQMLTCNDFNEASKYYRELKGIVQTILVQCFDNRFCDICGELFDKNTVKIYDYMTIENEDSGSNAGTWTQSMCNGCREHFSKDNDIISIKEEKK